MAKRVFYLAAARTMRRGRRVIRSPTAFYFTHLLYFVERSPSGLFHRMRLRYFVNSAIFHKILYTPQIYI